jgi:hypothetical protein
MDLQNLQIVKNKRIPHTTIYQFVVTIVITATVVWLIYRFAYVDTPRLNVYFAKQQ